MKKKTKFLNSAEISFPALSQNESFARSVVSAFLMQANPTIEEISDMKCAVSEAVTNAIVHGYAGGAGIVKMKMRLSADREATIEIKDKGRGIEDVALAMTPMFTTNSDGDRTGMGFTVMQTFTDRIKVTSKVGKGTRVKLVKKLSGDDT